MKILNSDNGQMNGSAPLRGKALRLAVSVLLGNSIFNPAGELLGKIKDVMIDVTAGKVEYVVIGFGGFLGMNQKHFVAPMQSLSVATARANAFVLNETKAFLTKIAKTGNGPLTKYKFTSP
jgi:sporulation protein YlmC with PRC-barrel domain